MLKYVKLLSGEDFIAKILPDHENETHFCYSNGLALVQSNKGVGLRPFLPFSKDAEQFHVLKSAVVIQTEVFDELAEQYNEMFNELILPNAGKLIL